MRQTGIPVLSLRGVDFRFWSRLAISGKSANIFSVHGFVWGCTRRNMGKKSFLTPIFLLGVIRMRDPRLHWYRSE